MNKPVFYITDVFGFEKYSGNQLATFLNCDCFDDGEMQKIAREINFAETTFITSLEKNNNGYNVRIFTPQQEIDFAGHPTLGTAYIIYKYLENGKADKVILNLKVGQIPVEIKKSELWMKQAQPQFGENLQIDLLSETLGVVPNDFDTSFPIQEVSTGLPFIIVPLKTINVLKKIKVNLDNYDNLIKKTWAKAIFVFCSEGYIKNHDLSSRMFANYYGVPEDPATGSANGCLAAYLLKYNYFNKTKINIKVGQGFEIGRPSEILINANKLDKIFEIYVGGKVIEVAEGYWK